MARKAPTPPPSRSPGSNTQRGATGRPLGGQKPPPPPPPPRKR